MPVTISMIEEKEFKTKMRGYDPVEVDAFLDEICDEIEAMQDEIASLQARLNQSQVSSAFTGAVPAPAPVAEPIAPVPAPKAEPVVIREDNSEAAQRLLARAQKVYDDTIADAKAEAEEILKNAHSRADNGIADLEAERESIKEEIEMLKGVARDYRDRFVRLIKDQQHVLDAETKLFD